MTSICLYFQVHQPRRLRRIQSFKPPTEPDYWDAEENERILDRAAEKCYLPANETIRDLIHETDGRFKVAFSLSGVFLDQARRHRPDVLASFRELARTGNVEFLAETYYHSLAGLWDEGTEFEAQVRRHGEAIEREFGHEPTVFRNTELIYDDRIADQVDGLGYEAILTEGSDRLLGWRSPNHLYEPQSEGNDLSVLLKNYQLSDDVAFRFSTPGWSEQPLTADKFTAWLDETPGETINLFMDYETFGEHQWPQTGIFDFLEALPRHVDERSGLSFASPSELVDELDPVGTIEAPQAVSWADQERDVSAWLHNKMQQECFAELQRLEPLVHAVGDRDLMQAWRLLQTSDHLYYCSTKGYGDQEIHEYFSPYDSPYVAYINFMNALGDLKEKARRRLREQGETEIEATAPAQAPLPG
ncbi:alpha-amylase [Thermoplasmatales archaeon SW_10_69_26]|nr:MAG: alpha-amylase [Thermoplasmatales archaeon SW_10_69_26]